LPKIQVNCPPSDKMRLMYYICKFRSTWSLFDQNGKGDQVLESDEIVRIKQYFAGLLEDGKILTGLQIVPLPPNKRLPDLQPHQYLISKFFSKWMIFEGDTQTERWLDPAEIAWVKKLIPDVTAGANNVLHLLVSSVQPGKLLQLSLDGKPDQANRTPVKAANSPGKS